MAPTRARTLDIYEGERNPSILATSQDDFDLHDDWNELDRGFGSRWRNSCPEKKSTSSTSRLTSRLTSLSLSLTGAGTALTTRAKHLSLGDSTHQTINRLRKAVKGGASPRTEILQRSATTARHGRPCDEVDDKDDQPESESVCYDDDMYANLKVLHSPVKPVRAGRAKTLTKWIRHRSSNSN
uniref:Uncharacterized protein n=1 Tax=Hyaloperonospora arabidopsidis (strain Emoy2) TaxID=559515 RepID=M4BPT0_HYAAE